MSEWQITYFMSKEDFQNIITWTYLKYGLQHVYLLKMLKDITNTSLKIKMISA